MNNNDIKNEVFWETGLYIIGYYYSTYPLILLPSIYVTGHKMNIRGLIKMNVLNNVEYKQYAIFHVLSTLQRCFPWNYILKFCWCFANEHDCPCFFILSNEKYTNCGRPKLFVRYVQRLPGDLMVMI